MSKMFEIRPMEIEDVRALAKEPWNEEISYWPPSKFHLLSKQTNCASIFVNGELSCILGVVEYWKGRAHIWGIFGQVSAKYPVASFRAVKKFVHIQPYARLEAAAPPDLEVAGRRLRMLGFQLECGLARKYTDTGESQALYAWVRE